MWELNEVTAIECRERYVYHITFDDGLQGDVDFSEYLGRGPVFEPVKDMAFFREARIEGERSAGQTARVRLRRHSMAR